MSPIHHGDNPCSGSEHTALGHAGAATYRGCSRQATPKNWPVPGGSRTWLWPRWETTRGPNVSGVLPSWATSMPSVLLAAHPDPRKGIHLGLAHPAAQRLRRSDTQLGGDRLDRGPLRALAGSYLGDHPDRTLPQLRRIFRSSHAQDPIAFSTDGASGHAGGLHSHWHLGVWSRIPLLLRSRGFRRVRDVVFRPEC